MGATCTRRAGLAGLLALGLAGCSSLKPASPGAAPEAPPLPVQPGTAASALDAALTVEQRWLSDWFRGTPVRITRNGDGDLDIEVPRAFCFEPGRDALQPALAAVLDKAAESLRRVPAARLMRLAAPGDGAATAASTALALRRAGRVQRHLRGRGVPAARLAAPSVAEAAAVQLRLGADPGG